MLEESGYVVVVTCVVLSFSDGMQRALILKRSEEESEGPGLWTIPGGKIERGDWGDPAGTASHVVWKGAIARAMAREIEEETGIMAKPGELGLCAGGDIIFKRKSGMPTIVLCYTLVLETSPMILLGDGATAYRWVSEEEIGAYRCIGNVAEDVRNALRAYQERAR